MPTYHIVREHTSDGYIKTFENWTVALDSDEDVLSYLADNISCHRADVFEITKITKEKLRNILGDEVQTTKQVRKETTEKRKRRTLYEELKREFEGEAPQADRQKK